MPRKGGPLGSIFYFIAFLFSLTSSLSASPEVENFKAYHPRAFFNEFESDYFPELQALGPEHNETFESLIRFLETHGISIAIGANANTQSIFELYAPVIFRAEPLDGPIVGSTPESSVGNLYFILHDAAHHFVGIPGLRKKDLKDKELSKKRLIEIMLDKEQVATVFSLTFYIRHYWNWRDERRHGRVRDDFVDLNNGIFPYGPLNAETYVDFIGDMVHGRPLQYFQKILRNYSSKQTTRARNVGVPLAFPNLSKLFGARLEAEIYRWLLPPIATLAGYYGEVAHLGFKKYSEAQADFMLQDWYVNWSEDFQIGYPLDELEQRAAQALATQKQGKHLSLASDPKNQDFDRKQLQHEIAYLARRVAEVIELNRQQKYDFLNTIQLNFLKDRYLELKDLWKTIHNTPSDLQLAESSLDHIASELEAQVPIPNSIPIYLRIPFIDYQNYWRDMTALAVPRYGHNSNGMTPAGIKNRVQARRQAQKSFFVRMKDALRSLALRKVRGIPTFVEREEKLAKLYEADQEALQKPSKEQPLSPENRYEYLNALDRLGHALATQFNTSLLPQIIETEFSMQHDKQLLMEKLNLQMQSASYAIADLRKKYIGCFIERKLPTNEFVKAEVHLNIALDEMLGLWADILKALEHGHWQKKKKKFHLEIQNLTNALATGRYYETKRSLGRYISQLFPVSSQRHRAIPSIAMRLITPYAYRNSFGQAIRQFSSRLFLRKNNQHSFKLIGEKPKQAEPNSVHVLTLNHEGGIIDPLIALDIFESMTIEEIIILGSQAALPELKSTRYRDKNIIVAESDKPLDQIIERVKNQPGKRVGILICPEGNLPSPRVDMPLAAKPGAFVLLKKLTEQTAHSVFLHSGIINGARHLTSAEPIDLELVLDTPLRIETGISNHKIEDLRMSFENRVNRDRAMHLVDLNHLRRASGGSAWVTSPVYPYLDFASWFGAKVLDDCKTQLAGL